MKTATNRRYETHPLIDEFRDFMFWFKMKYPQYYTRFHKNFDMPFHIGEQVRVNNEYQISRAEYHRLQDMVALYYRSYRKEKPYDGRPHRRS